MYNGEDAFATDPLSIFVLNPSIVHGGSLVEANAAVLNGPREGDLIWVEILPA